jgi:hypothetical protein
MTSKTVYWLADPEGTRAPVEGAGVRDYLIRVQGWTEADEPDRHDFVWLHNADNPELGRARMTWEAAQLPAWAGRGWAPGLSYAVGGDVGPAAEPAKTTKSPAASGEKKE